MMENIIYLNFVKSTIFKSKIKKANTEESTLSFQANQ